MTLIKCPSCNKEISPKATACPSCGHPIKPQKTPRRYGCTGIVLLSILALMAIGYLGNKLEGCTGTESSSTLNSKTENPKTKPPSKSSSDLLDDEIEQRKHEQPHRKKIINTLIEEGYIQKITVPTSLYPRMYVERKFYSLTYDDKKALSIIVWSYYLTKNRKVDILIIRDGYTGKDIRWL